MCDQCSDEVYIECTLREGRSSGQEMKGRVSRMGRADDKCAAATTYVSPACLKNADMSYHSLVSEHTALWVVGKEVRFVRQGLESHSTH